MLNKGAGTTQNVDHIVETDSSVSLLCFFEQILNLMVLVFGQVTPFLVQQFFKVLSTSPSHNSNIYIYVTFPTHMNNHSYVILFIYNLSSTPLRSKFF